MKAWEESRSYCHTQYADLFSWRDNRDESFIRPLIQNWIVTPGFINAWSHVNHSNPNQPYRAWTGATVISTSRK